jgi:hypothetical protein
MVYMDYFELVRQSIVATNIITADTGSVLNVIAETLIKTVMFMLLGYVVLKAVLKVLKSHAMGAAEAIGAHKLAEKAFAPAEALAEMPFKAARMPYKIYKGRKQTKQFGGIDKTLKHLSVNPNTLDANKQTILSKARRTGFSTEIAEAMMGVPLDEAAIKQLTPKQKQETANEIIKQAQIWNDTAPLRIKIKRDKDLSKIQWLSNDIEIAKTIKAIREMGGSMPVALEQVIEELEKDKKLHSLQRDVVLNQIFKRI